MGIYCQGKCLELKAEPVANGLRYDIGQKWCSNCSIFMKIEEVKCPCCHASLRRKPKIRNQNY